MLSMKQSVGGSMKQSVGGSMNSKIFCQTAKILGPRYERNAEGQVLFVIRMLFDANQSIPSDCIKVNQDVDEVNVVVDTGASDTESLGAAHNTASNHQSSSSSKSRCRKAIYDERFILPSNYDRTEKLQVSYAEPELTLQMPVCARLYTAASYRASSPARSSLSATRGNQPHAVQQTSLPVRLYEQRLALGFDWCDPESVRVAVDGCQVNVSARGGPGESLESQLTFPPASEVDMTRVTASLEGSELVLTAPLRSSRTGQMLSSTHGPNSPYQSPSHHTPTTSVSSVFGL